MGKHPDHTAKFEYPKDHYVVKVGDTIIVDTTSAIVINEVSPRGALPPVVYFPFDDVQKEYLIPTDLHTFCPIKGEASYYSLIVNGNSLENVAWYYPAPLEYVEEITGSLSFYSDKVTIVKES